MTRPPSGTFSTNLRNKSPEHPSPRTAIQKTYCSDTPGIRQPHCSKKPQRSEAPTQAPDLCSIQSLLVTSLCSPLYPPGTSQPPVLRSLPCASLIRFAVRIHPLSPVSRTAKRTTAPSHPLRCHHRFASVCPCPAKPTTAPSRPLRCINSFVSIFSRAATPIPAPPRPLRCHHRFASVFPCPAKPTTALSCPLRCTHRSISACFRAAKPIPAPSRPLRCFLLPVLPAIFTAKRTIESPELLRYYLDLLYKDLGDFL